MKIRNNPIRSNFRDRPGTGVWFWPTQLVALGIAKTHKKVQKYKQGVTRSESFVLFLFVSPNPHTAANCPASTKTLRYPSSQKQTITLWGCFLAVGLPWLVAKDRYWLQKTQGFLNWELKERYHASNEPSFEIAQGTWFPQCHNHSTQWLQNCKLEHQTRECTRKLEHSTFTYGSTVSLCGI